VKVRLGLLRQYIHEAVSMTSTTSPSAPTDPDATVPGHLPNELPMSAALEEQGWVPGRWDPTEGEPMDPSDVERLGSSGMEETDERMVDDGKGNGIPDPEINDDMSPHLRDSDHLSLGSPPQERPEKSRYDESAWLNREIRRYLLQEYPAGAGMVDPVTPPKGFYSDYDAEKDHGTPDQIQKPWYRSPGREPGGDGDPFRGDDPYTQLGFHSPRGPSDGTTPPAVSGEEGVAARKAPEEWTLNAGDDTSSVLGPGAKPPSSAVGSEDGSEEGEEGEAGEGEGTEPGKPADGEAEGEEQE
jgi:hypothetical protein